VATPTVCQCMWNEISEWEVRLSDEAIKALRDVPWAVPLLARLDPAKETRAQNRSLLFEIRFAYALHQAGHVAEYEYRGADSSTIDFRVVTQDYEWLIELVSVCESDAVQRATQQMGLMQSLLLSGIPGKDSIASEAGEMIKAEEKIAEKVFSKGKPTKFSEPSGKVINVILTDMRGYLGIGEHVIDNDDYRQIAYGPARLPDHHVQWWAGSPIKGLFQKDNPTKAAKYIRERVHILAFVCEREYTATEICSRVFCTLNPSLFSSTDQMRATLNQCPARVCPVAKC
jgi:hypothetical protein